MYFNKNLQLFQQQYHRPADLNYYAIMQFKGEKGVFEDAQTLHSPVPYNVRTHFSTTPEQELYPLSQAILGFS